SSKGKINFNSPIFLESYSIVIEKNVFDVLEILLRFMDLFDNILNSELHTLISDQMKKTINECFANFCTFSKIDLGKLREAFYEKVGYAFVDFKGNFSKKNFNIF